VEYLGYRHQCLIRLYNYFIVALVKITIGALANAVRLLGSLVLLGFMFFSYLHRFESLHRCRWDRSCFSWVGFHLRFWWALAIVMALLPKQEPMPLALRLSWQPKLLLDQLAS
jgi:hypothetical protein